MNTAASEEGKRTGPYLALNNIHGKIILLSSDWLR